MKNYFKTLIGRLRLLAFLEGGSLILLVFIAVPLKYMYESPLLVEIIGPIHGALFLGFAFYTIRVSLEEGWKFWQRTFWVGLSSFIPFGTFYVDHKILKGLHEREMVAKG